MDADSAILHFVCPSQITSSSQLIVLVPFTAYAPGNPDPGFTTPPVPTGHHQASTRAPTVSGGAVLVSLLLQSICGYTSSEKLLQTWYQRRNGQYHLLPPEGAAAPSGQLQARH